MGIGPDCGIASALGAAEVAENRFGHDLKSSLSICFQREFNHDIPYAKRILSGTLRTACLLKEESGFVFERARNRDTEKYLRIWKIKAEHAGGSFLGKFVKTLENWWNEIPNCFFERITNGFVEGTNGALRNIIRRAFGYGNFANFRCQAMAEQKYPTIPR